MAQLVKNNYDGFCDISAEMSPPRVAVFVFINAVAVWGGFEVDVLLTRLRSGVVSKLLFLF